MKSLQPHLQMFEFKPVRAFIGVGRYWFVFEFRHLGCNPQIYYKGLLSGMQQISKTILKRVPSRYLQLELSTYNEHQEVFVTSTKYLILYKHFFLTFQYFKTSKISKFSKLIF